MTKIQAIGLKEKGKPFRVISSENFKKELNEIPEGRYRLTVEKMRRNKSLSQLGYLFGVVYPLVLEHLLSSGYEPEDITENPDESLKIEHIDLMCKKMFASKKIVNRETGDMIEIPGFKRDFSTVEMMTYINAIRQWDAEYLGGYIPEPLEQLTIEV